MKNNTASFIKICLIGIFLTLLISGCGTAGKDFDESLYTKIVKGTTTQKEIQAMFGPPFKKGIQNGLPVWTYEYNHYKSIGPNTHKDMIIVFDKNGVVQSHQLMSNSPQ
ncbi:MAG: outer membrane protein assembly factor BamE [Nitrospinota bacterium]